jgi:hypothetical protein
LLNAEEFQEIITAVAEDKDITKEQVAGLIDVIHRLDLQLLIAQNGLELSLANVNVIVPDLAERVLAMSGRTDNKSKKKVAELAAGTVVQFQDSVQTYLVNATLEAMELLGITPENFALEETDLDNDLWVPHNHD